LKQVHNKLAEQLKEEKKGKVLSLDGRRGLEEELIYGCHDDHLTRLQAILLLQSACIKKVRKDE